MQNLFRYLGFIIGGFIFQIIKRKFSKRNKEKNNSGIKLIYAKKKFTKRQIFDIIIIGLFFCIAFEAKKLLYIMNFYFIDFWPFNIVFIIIFMNIYFKMEFYNFQKLSLLFVVISNLILLLINTFLRQPRDPEKRNEYEIYRDTMGNAALCVPFILLFIFLHCCLSYVRVKIKLLTTVQFVSNYVIIIAIGLCGIVLTIIEIIFSENIKCNLDKMKEAFRPLCLVNTTKTEYYHDKLDKFFGDFRSLSSINAFINILLILFYPVINFLEILVQLLIIYYLNPIYLLVRDNIYRFITRIIFESIGAKKNASLYFTPKFFILELAEILALLGECVYLQLIELKFCNLDVNLNKNIIDRSKEDSKLLEIITLNDNQSDIFLDDEKVIN